MADKLLSPRVFPFCRLPLSFFQSIQICFAISFCILAFPLRGFIRNMNILLGDIPFIFILYSFSNNLVTNIFFPGEQGTYLENGICPPFLLYKLSKFFLQIS